MTNKASQFIGDLFHEPCSDEAVISKASTKALAHGDGSAGRQRRRLSGAGDVVSDDPVGALARALMGWRKRGASSSAALIVAGRCLCVASVARMSGFSSRTGGVRRPS